MPSPLGSLFHSPINCSFLCTLMMLHILLTTPFSPLVQVFHMFVDTRLKVIQERRNYLINLYITHHLSKTTFLIAGLQKYWPHWKRLPKPVYCANAYKWRSRISWQEHNLYNSYNDIFNSKELEQPLKSLSSCPFPVMGPNWKQVGVGDRLKLGSPKRKNTPFYTYPLSCNSIKASERNS